MKNSENALGLIITFRGGDSKILCPETNQIYNAKLSGKFQYTKSKAVNPIAVGDYVFYTLNSDNLALIHSIKPRKNGIERQHTHNTHYTLVIAANLDLVLVMLTLKQPKTPLGFIDRILIELEAFDIPAILLFNKIDLLLEKDLQHLHQIKTIYESIGYPCYQISVLKDNDGIEILLKQLDQKITLFIGNSGVGKSTLINKLSPKAQQKTAEVSKYNEKGKHTTTFVQIFNLKNKGFIIDTPGLKQFGLAGIDYQKIGSYFREFKTFSINCKFHNCTHSQEPNCAILKAVEEGKIHKERYNSYLNIFKSYQS